MPFVQQGVTQVEVIKLKQSHIEKVKSTLNILAVLASIVLISSISLEAFGDNPFSTGTIYTDVQLWICAYFVFDFFVSLFLAEKKRRYFLRSFFILLMGIPYLTVISYWNVDLNQEQVYLIRLLPLFRGAAALVLIVSIVVQHNTTALFISYLIFLGSIVYFLTLIFFVVEHGVNPDVHSYADSLWWAAMTVTTLGSNIQPVTVAGKIITTAMALVGLTIFPIFTAYITTLINRIAQHEFTNRQAQGKNGQTPNDPSSELPEQ